MTQQLLRSTHLRLVPSRLRTQSGSKPSQLTLSPSLTPFKGIGLFESSALSEQKPRPSPKPSSPKSPSSPQANLSFIETEPWTPPADAHPQIGLLEFTERAWRILEPSEPFVRSWHLELFAKHAEAVSLGHLDEHSLLVNTPPGTTKSLFWSVFWPAWEWTWAPWRRWLTLSYDESLALRDAVKTRRLMHTDWYRRVAISEPWDFVGDQNVKGNYVNNRTGWRIATSIKGAVTGNHAHVVLVDDPHSVKKAESDAEREATLDIWRETIPSRVLPSGSRILIGQRTHEEDVTADWLAREGDEIHHIELKMEHETPSGSTAERIRELTRTCTLDGKKHDPRKTDGELLVPQRFPKRVLERRKLELGPYAYSAQFQQAPTPRKGMLLDPNWFQQTPRLEPGTVDLIAAIDLNYSEMETSDWTWAQLAAVERTPIVPRIHLIDARRDHLSEERHAETLAEWLLLWRPIAVVIEKRAYEKVGACRDLCRRIREICYERGYAVNIEPIEAEGDKISRAMIIPGRAQPGYITVDRRAPWWPDMSKQMSTFPRSAHDDAIDAVAYVVKLAVEKLISMREMSNLLGHSAAVVIGEAPERPDWAATTLAGIR